MELCGQRVLGKHTLLLSYISNHQRGSSQHRKHGAHDPWLELLPLWSTSCLHDTSVGVVVGTISRCYSLLAYYHRCPLPNLELPVGARFSTLAPRT